MAPGSPPLEFEHQHHTRSIDHDDLHADLIEAIRGRESADDSTQGLPVGARVEVPATAGGGEVDVAEEDIIPIAPADETVDVALSTCPVCYHRYPPEAGFCANCGYDPGRGIQSSRFIEASRAPRHGHGNQPLYACPQCHYDMAHARSLVCPGCGHHMPTRDRSVRHQAAAIPPPPGRTRWRLVGLLGLVAAAVGAGLLLSLGLWP
jgi:hypothetical protein